MIGIITAEAVITSEILLLANTQEITLAHRFYTMVQLIVWIQNPLIRCLSCFSLFNLQGTLRIAVFHAANRDSLNTIAHLFRKVKDFFQLSEKIFELPGLEAPGSQVPDYYIPHPLLCQAFFHLFDYISFVIYPLWLTSFKNHNLWGLFPLSCRSSPCGKHFIMVS